LPRGGIVAGMSEDAPDSAPPDAANLRAAAIAYLARYSATRATLARMLNRRIDRWLREAAGPGAAAQAATAKRAVQAVVAQLADAGAVNDAAFAEARARKLVRTGHSRRAAAAHLAARGVPAEVVRTALPQDEAGELAAAIAHMRRRRLGPFRADAAAPHARQKDLASLARAGFTGPTARRALALPQEEAETLLLQRRQQE